MIDQIVMLRSILGFLAKGILVLHLGHFGLFFIIKTYDKHPGQPAATGELYETLSSPEFSSFIDDDDEEYEGDGELDFHAPVTVRLLESARSSADLTLSSVHTLWYAPPDPEPEPEPEVETSFRSRLESSKRLNAPPPEFPPENFFVEEAPDGKLRFRSCDFGGFEFCCALHL